MSFGDGIAVSIGTMIGGEKIINPDGQAIAISTNHTSVMRVPTPLDSSTPNFEESSSVTFDNLNFEKIIYNNAEAFVENRVYTSHTFSVCNREAVYSIGVNVTSGTNSVYMNQAIAQVIDINDNNKYINQYLTLRPDKINSQVASVYIAGSTINSVNNKYHLSYTPVKTKITTTRKEVIATVNDIDSGKMVINPVNTFVENGMPQKINPSITVSPASANVYDYKPPTSTNVTSGEGLQSFYIVLQKYSYFEQALTFSNAKVINITGLPMGMVFEKATLTLKGSPQISGDYPLGIKLDNNTTLSGLLVVTNVPRKL